LTGRLQNDTDAAVRVCDPHNSWGGSSWSLHLGRADAGRELVLRPNKQPYTANLPRVVEVPPHAARDVPLTPGDHAWTFGEDLSVFRDVPVRVRVVLVIAAPVEATELRVATGHAESGDVAQAPHGRLFGTATDRPFGSSRWDDASRPRR
jgi:hypothetical protein